MRKTKKLAALMLAGAMAASLAACGGQTASTDTTAAESADGEESKEAEQTAGVPEEIGPEQLPHGTSKGEGISWKEPEEKKEFREELPKKDAEYRVPIGSNLL